MAPWGDLDLTQRLAPILPRWLTTLGVTALCLLIGFFVRQLLDQVAPAAAPFALMFPAMMTATLLGRWPAGAMTGGIAFLWAWYFMTPVKGSFQFENEMQMYNVGVVAVAAAITLALAEVYRRSVHQAVGGRDRAIADRDLLLAEFDHRMKNNFAIVASILEIQQRRVGAEAADALATAQRRIESIARANRHLYRSAGEAQTVEMRDYLGDLCNALADALFLRGGVTLVCSCDPAALDRDRAVSIGLVVNELVTNAAKHAFRDRDGGRIQVSFRARGGGWSLIVADDGVGMPDAPTEAGSGLGSRLIPAFARQAGGVLTIDSGREGTTAVLDLPA